VVGRGICRLSQLGEEGVELRLLSQAGRWYLLDPDGNAIARYSVYGHGSSLPAVMYLEIKESEYSYLTKLTARMGLITL
jgi:hypothetical protein